MKSVPDRRFLLHKSVKEAHLQSCLHLNVRQRLIMGLSSNHVEQTYDAVEGISHDYHTFIRYEKSPAYPLGIVRLYDPH